MGSGRPVLKVGDVLGGKYRIDRMLGAGGIGIVAAATHLELGKSVAVKVLQQDSEPDQRERFLREARAAVRLQGDHVARVLDVGRQTSGAPYMVMELLQGEDLGHAIDRGPMPIAQAVDFILQACEGLAEAHAAGIVHRDLKPRNLFLTRRVHGQPLIKLLDFGLAKIVFGDKQITATQDVMGSPQYMSPEQMRALRDVDLRTDIWSLGVCLYEFLTGGVTPFDAPAIPEIFGRVLTMPPWPIHDRRADVPIALWQAILKCLEKEPSARFQNVWEVAVALEPFASQPGAADRVRAVLETPPAPVPDTSEPSFQLAVGTATQNAFDSSGDRSKKNMIAIGAGVIAALIGAGILALVIGLNTRTKSPAAIPGTAQALPPPQPTVTTTMMPPTVTNIEPAPVSKDAGTPAISTAKVQKPMPKPPAATAAADAGVPRNNQNNPSGKF